MKDVVLQTGSLATAESGSAVVYFNGTILLMEGDTPDYAEAVAVQAIVGAASVTIGPATSENPAQAFTGSLPVPLAAPTLLAIAVGAIAANCMNVYSGAMAFVTIGITLGRSARAVVTLLLGVLGLLIARWALADAAEESS